MTLTWKRSERHDGYDSTDGVWTIEHQEAYTFCENPHPQGKGNPYCTGGEEHPYLFWVLWRNVWGSDGERMDAGQTLRQMKASAEQFAQKEPSA